MSEHPTSVAIKSDNVTDEVGTNPDEVRPSDGVGSNDNATKHPTRRFRVGGDQVNAATADLPDKERSEIRWLHAYMDEHDLIPDEIGPKLKKEGGGAYSGDSVYQLLTGRRESGTQPMAEAIARFRKLEEQRSQIIRAPFVTTKLSQRIWKLCEGALIYQKICFIVGASQIGKTTALMEYAREHNHGQTIYVEMPSSGNLGDFLVALAEALRISTNLPQKELRRRTKRAFDARMLLIVDQAHEPLENERTTRVPLSLKFIMEIYNAAKCGVILAGTDVLEHGFKQGVHRKILRQLELRGLAWQRLPDAPSVGNLREFAASYGLEPAQGKALQLQSAVILDHGLGRWCTILQAASRLADKAKQKLTWPHVLKADAGLRAMETTTDDLD